MKYTATSIYNYVVRKVMQSYPTIYHSSTYQPIISEIPAIFIELINQVEPLSGLDLTYSSEIYRTTFEVNIFSETLEELDDIASIIKSAFKSMYFRLIFCDRVPNKDYTKKRIVARFERTICGGDEMPQS